jgi:hypothetical protein
MDGSRGYRVPFYGTVWRYTDRLGQLYSFGLQLDRLPAEVRRRSGEELPINPETLSSVIARALDVPVGTASRGGGQRRVSGLHGDGDLYAAICADRQSRRVVSL